MFEYFVYECDCGDTPIIDYGDDWGRVANVVRDQWEGQPNIIIQHGNDDLPQLDDNDIVLWRRPIAH